MNTQPTLEQRLEAALATNPRPETLTWIDERVVTAIDRVSDVRLPWMRRGARVGLVFVLLAAVAGGAIAGSGIVGQLAQRAPAFATAWERATVINQTQRVEGWTVTVERAYVDANQIVIGISSTDADGQPASVGQVELRVDGVVDAAPMTGVGDQDAILAGNLLTFATPADAADNVALTLTTRSPSATFRFSAPNSGGRTVNPRIQTAAAGIAVTLDHLTVSPTAIRGTLSFAGQPADGEAWSPVGAVESGATSAAFALVQTADSGQATFQTVIGSDSPAGTWRIRIDEIVGHRNGEQIRIAGPWRFEVEID